MLKKIVFVALILSMLVACAQPAETTDELVAAPTNTAAPSQIEADTNTPDPPATNTPAPSPTPDLVASCKLRNGSSARSDVSIGFPRPKGRTPSIGEITAAVLFVDFSDHPSQVSPEERLAVIAEGADFFREVSYGQMELVLVPHLEWLRMSQPSSAYNYSTAESHHFFIQEAVELADPGFDFSGIDQIIVLTPPNVSSFSFGPAYTAGGWRSFSNADGPDIENAVTSGSDMDFWGFLWLNHEMLHSLGLPDLYPFSSSPAGFYVGDFSLMARIDGRAPEPFAFERWLLGWVDNNQVVCNDASELTVELTAVESLGGTKMVVVPLSKNRAVVIESRRAIGYDDQLSKGALVYIADANNSSGEGLIQVVRQEGSGYLNAPLGVGESLTVEGITITVLESGDLTDTIQITK